MDLRIIWGCVNSNGQKHSGSKDSEGHYIFNVDKTGVGTYVVSYDESFRVTPAVVVTQNFISWEDFGYEGSNTRDNCVLVASDKKKFKVITGNSEGTRIDRNFTFITIGPK